MFFFLATEIPGQTYHYKNKKAYLLMAIPPKHRYTAM